MRFPVFALLGMLLLPGVAVAHEEGHGMALSDLSISYRAGAGATFSFTIANDDTGPANGMIAYFHFVGPTFLLRDSAALGDLESGGTAAYTIDLNGAPAAYGCVHVATPSKSTDRACALVGEVGLP